MALCVLLGVPVGVLSVDRLLSVPVASFSRCCVRCTVGVSHVPPSAHTHTHTRTGARRFELEREERNPVTGWPEVVVKRYDDIPALMRDQGVITKFVREGGDIRSLRLTGK